MRYYQTDGTFQENPHDVEFGWYFSDIAIDEAAPTFKEQNEKIRCSSSLRTKSVSTTINSKPLRIGQCQSTESSGNEYGIEECVDVLAVMNSESKATYKVEPNIKIETAANSISYQTSVEGFIENPESNFYKQIKNCRVPSKNEMIALINPVNPESKALLSVISDSKYRNLNDKDTNDNVLKSINFKTTNSKRIIGTNDLPFKMDREFPNFNFLLNDGDVAVDHQLVSEIRNYHATKEDNMLSLMMELIITDMDSSLGDISELNNSVNDMNIVGTTETSDLGPSIHSSLTSKEGNGSKRKQHSYLNLPNRSDILSSIGLTDDIDKSIENFTKEKSEMYLQLCDIKKSFEEDEKKVNNLISEAISLQNDLRETAYLENLIHLLSGNPEKVKNKKLPFRIFYKSMDDNEADFNLII